MTQQLFIGVDGGASKVSIRVEDENGVLLGKEKGGPASIRYSVEKTWQSIYAVLEKILQPLHISLNDKQYRLHAGMGLAGCELHEAYQAFLNHPHPFTTLIVSSDAHTACLGAHRGEEGSVIVIGTGVVGFQWEVEQTIKVSGWGFPHDDEGSGAWLGLQALRLTLKWLDKRTTDSPLTRAIYAYFGENLAALVAFANHADASDFAKLAPFVIECAKEGDNTAIFLLQKAGQAMNEINEALLISQSKEKTLPCVLMGGIAPFIEPYLGEKLRSRLTQPQATPDVGAILLLQQNLFPNKSLVKKGE